MLFDGAATKVMSLQPDLDIGRCSRDDLKHAGSFSYNLRAWETPFVNTAF